MKATGKAGVLRFKYQVAVRLGDWTLEPVLILPRHQRYHLRGSVVSRHEPWSSRSPLDVYLEFGPNTWIWNGILIDTDASGVRLSIELHGPPTIDKGVPAA